MRNPAEQLVNNLQPFLAFALKRVGDPHLAEDVLQESLLKALKTGRKPVKNEEVTVWFYRILRRSIIDVYRRQGVRDRTLDKLKAELPEQVDAAAERALCQCFQRLLAGLSTQYRELLQKVDLDGMSPKEAASELGLTANNLTVRLYRARQRLRRELERSCGACSEQGCLDCSCEPPGGAAE